MLFPTKHKYKPINNKRGNQRKTLKGGKKKVNWYGTPGIKEHHDGKTSYVSLPQKKTTQAWNVSTPKLETVGSPSKLTPPPDQTEVPPTTQGKPRTMNRGRWKATLIISSLGKHFPSLLA